LHPGFDSRLDAVGPRFVHPGVIIADDGAASVELGKPGVEVGKDGVERVIAIDVDPVKYPSPNSFTASIEALRWIPTSGLVENRSTTERIRSSISR